MTPDDRTRLIARLQKWERAYGVSPSGKGEAHCGGCGMRSWLNEPETHSADCPLLLVRDVLALLAAPPDEGTALDKEYDRIRNWALAAGRAAERAVGNVGTEQWHRGREQAFTDVLATLAALRQAQAEET